MLLDELRSNIADKLNKSIGAYSKFAIDAVMDVITPAWIDILAKVEEYEHALDHVLHCGSCRDCMRLAESALARENKKDFEEIALTIYDPIKHFLLDEECPWCGLKVSTHTSETYRQCILDSIEAE